MLGTKSISYIFRYAENKIHWTHRLGIGKSNGFVSNITFVLAFSFCAGFSSRLSFKVCILLSLLLIHFSVYHFNVANGKCLLTCKIKHFQFLTALRGHLDNFFHHILPRSKVPHFQLFCPCF